MMQHNHSGRLAAAVLFIPALIGAGAALAQTKNVCVDPKAFAIGEEEQAKSTLMDERVFKRLQNAHDAFGEKRYDDALKTLRALESSNINAYENALVQQTFGFIYADQEKYKEAIPYFEKSLALKALPAQAQQGMLYSLAGLYAAEGQHRKTIETMQRWFPYAPEVKGDAYIMVAAAYAEMQDFDNARPCVVKAIELADEPKESWYQLLLAIHFEKQEFAKAADLLQKMVAFWPGKLSYWEMLSGAYQQQQKDQEALAAMKLAYDNGLITTESKILNLARMYLFVGLPFEGGRLLGKELEQGRVESNEKNLKLLLNAWTQAREFDNAIAAIDKLAPMSNDGQYYLQKAQLYAEKNSWSQVVESVDQALDKGGLSKPGAAYVLKGMALAELEDFKRALEALEAARGYDDSSRKQADGWIDFVNDRIRIAS